MCFSEDCSSGWLAVSQSEKRKSRFGCFFFDMACLQRLMVVSSTRMSTRQRQSSLLLLRIMGLDLVLGCTYNDIPFEELVVIRRITQSLSRDFENNYQASVDSK